MYFTKANLQVKLAGAQAEAERIVFGCGAAPCWTLVVNAARHADIDAFLRAARPVRQAFVLAGGKQGRINVNGVFSVARFRIGTAADLYDWDELDAVLMADSFDKLADVLAEFEPAAS